jgi:hypothetical protein
MHLCIGADLHAGGKGGLASCSNVRVSPRDHNRATDSLDGVGLSFVVLLSLHEVMQRLIPLDDVLDAMHCPPPLPI